ncbi:DNA repair protein RecO [Candidatus Falkowbacteria bacterium]|nr:DNA repair protein RecO [Candidatus Falkowbacteria bacterium]
MEETYFTKAIVLNRTPWREDGARVTVYSKERGKLDLMARGARKAGSKLAAHLEPITFSRLMVVRGKNYDYAGSTVSENSYFNIKNDLEKIFLAGGVLKIFNELVKGNERDEYIFFLLQETLKILNSEQMVSAKGGQLLYNFFILKLLVFLGHKPELYNCVVCHKRITPGDGNKFDLAKGGVACGKCSPAGLTISDDCIKVLRVVVENGLANSIKLKINNKLEKEATNIISSFLKYNFSV